MAETDEPSPGPEPPRPAATFFTILFTIALFVNMWWDSQTKDYNGVQNSLILAALAVAPPGIRMGSAVVAPRLARFFDRMSGGPK